MSKTRRRYLAAVGATLAIAGCQDGGGPTPEGTPGGAEEVAGEEGATPVPGEGDDTPGGDGAGADEDGADGGAEEPQDGTEGEEGNGNGDGTTAAVTVSDHETHGEILVNSEGVTLYVFEEDSQGAEESACVDECAENWPPFTTGGGEDPEADEGVQAEITTFERADGDTQVAANGWPLYTFVDDQSPGDANGQGVNDIWWVVDPNGEPIRDGGTDGGGDEGAGDDGEDGDTAAGDGE